MKHLSTLDAAFLHLETPEMPMHVGSLILLDLPVGLQGPFYDAVKFHVARRIHLASVFTKKLALMPLNIANPVWVDAGAVDLDYHIRHIRLPKPGTMAQLEAYVGRLHSRALDRSRPLWEFYVFDGLKSGQGAFYSKIHHAALDGQGALVLAQALLDLTPVPRAVEAAPAHANLNGQPAASQLLAAALRNTLAQCVTLVKGLPAGVKAAAGLLASAGTAGENGGQRDSGWAKRFPLAPRTPLNVSITGRRAFATLTLPLAQTQEIAAALGASLNDVVLGICSGGLRRYLDGKGALPEKSLVAALPVSLRAAGNADLNNQVSMMLLNLASEQLDPKQRMRAIVKASGAMKQTLSSVKEVMPTDFPSLGVPWLMTSLAALYGRARLADRLPPIANLVISNVQGPRVPLYLAGARLTGNFPVSIVTHGMALNITVQSYNGALDIGLIACRRAMPDLRKLVRCLRAAHEELLAMARAGAPAAAAASQPAAKGRARAGSPSAPIPSPAKPRRKVAPAPPVTPNARPMRAPKRGARANPALHP
jgi:diacylglycerol O-acyltransferase / wax synthase